MSLLPLACLDGEKLIRLLGRYKRPVIGTESPVRRYPAHGVFGLFITHDSQSVSLPPSVQKQVVVQS